MVFVNVDDDVYVEPAAVDELVRAYRAAGDDGWRAVAGTVSWAGSWSRPIVMRSIGWGRDAEPDEEPSFLISAMVLYPRALAVACPWFELVDRGEDRVAGALWRSKGVKLLYEPRARALHDHKHNGYDVRLQKDHLFANLVDAVVANPSPPRALAYDVLGFLAGAKTYFRRPKDAYLYVRAWALGHFKLVRHWRATRAAVKAPLPPPPE